MCRPFYVREYYNSTARVSSQVVANKVFKIILKIVLLLFDFFFRLCALCCMIISRKDFIGRVRFNK